MTERRISVFYDGAYYTFKWLKALLWAEKEFHQFGVDIDFISPKQYFPFKHGRDALPSRSKRQFDAVFIAHHHSGPGGLGELPVEELTSVLEEFRTRSNTIVWLDTADSTGTCKFEVMPYVDLYLKKQLLTDSNRYLSPIWGGRTFCEYYHVHHGVQDAEISDLKYSSLAPEYQDKVRTSWNVGLADLFTRSKYMTYARPHKYVCPSFEPPDKARGLDVHFRGSSWSSAAGWQRSRARELLLNRADLVYPDVNTKVSHGEYVSEIRNSYAVVSPFGWGEICTRDFEAFVYGATLLKPSMAHVDTYPSWYKEGETYISIDWDFDNFDEILDGIKAKPAEYRLIAENAQENYRYYLNGVASKREFVEHLLKNLGWL